MSDLHDLDEILRDRKQYTRPSEMRMLGAKERALLSKSVRELEQLIDGMSQSERLELVWSVGLWAPFEDADALRLCTIGVLTRTVVRCGLDHIELGIMLCLDAYQKLVIVPYRTGDAGS